MKQARKALALALYVAIFMAFPPPCFAEDQPRKTGFLADASVGVAGCTGKFCDSKDIGPSVGFLGGIFYRLHDLFAAGANFHYNTLSLSLEGSSNESAGFWIVGAEARGYAPFKGPLDIWASLSLGYTSFSISLFDANQDKEFGYSGFMAGLGIGGAYYLHQQHSLGATFRYTLPFFSKFCFMEGTEEGCVDIDEIGDEEFQGEPDYWYFGVAYNLHF